MRDITIGELFPGRRFFVITTNGERMTLRALGKTRILKGSTKFLAHRVTTGEELWIDSTDVTKMFIA